MAQVRDQISSRKEIATPIWLRRVISHSSTPPSSMPEITAPALPTRLAKKLAVKPQMHRVSVGQ